ncbi:MAG: MATE family efflux transporter [Lachnospiraceae bacterium]
MKKQKKNEIDMTTGSIPKKMIFYIVPLVITGILQLLYNAVDVIVVGTYVGTDALSAVGSTGSLINLLTNVFLGLSVGATVTVSKYYGAQDKEGLHRTVHTAILVSIVSGVILAILGVLLASPLLELMNTPPEVLGGAVTYMTIFFLGMPFNLLYNFGAAILRAVGDTKRPLYFLMVSGVVNVVLNLFFIIILGMGVGGVALATIISQALSAAFVVRCLMKEEGAIKLQLRKLRFYTREVISIVRIGLPAGVQGSFFSISNVLIQSSINLFGSSAMAGVAASSNLEGFIYIAMNAVHQAAVTFASQNIGASQYKRIRKNFFYSIGLVCIISCVMCGFMYLNSTRLISLYNSDPEVLEIAKTRFTFFCTYYFICGIMDVTVGHLRGIGRSVCPMIVTLCGVCLFRVIWIYTIFSQVMTLDILYVSYPVSWMMSTVVMWVYYAIIMRKLPKEDRVLSYG